MSITLQVPEPVELRPRLTVIGVGGAGGNAVNNMITAGLDGVDFIVANTDAQALLGSKTPNRIQLGQALTEGLGAGSKPEIGEAAAREAEDEIRTRIAGTHMLFIAAGMGGGTGTGAAAVIARIARELGVLTIAVVTKPFLFEGSRRMRAAEAGILELEKAVDTLIVIPNQNLFRIADEKTTFAEAFILADQVLYSGVACIVDLVVKDGLINLDLADVRTVLTDMGPAVMGTGEAEGERRAVRAAEAAIENRLLDDVSLVGAKGLLLSIIGGRELTLYEVDEAASRVRREVDPDANIIVGAAFDESLGDRVRVSIVASGLTRHSKPQASTTDGPRPHRSTAPAADPGPRYTNADLRPATQPEPPPSRPPVAPARPEVVVPASPPRPMPPPLPISMTRPSAGSASDNHDEALDAWSSDPEVMVSEVRPTVPPPLPADSAQPPERVAPTYVPQAPVDVPIRSVRMPDIRDFPDVIQKAYAEHKPTARPAPAPPSSPSPPPTAAHSGMDPKKGSLFRRLATAAGVRPKPSPGPDSVADFLSEPAPSRGSRRR